MPLNKDENENKSRDGYFLQTSFFFLISFVGEPASCSSNGMRIKKLEQITRQNRASETGAAD